MNPWRAAIVAIALGLLSTTGCVAPAPPAPATITTGEPPWAAPRDAVSHIDLAGLQQLPLSDTSDPHVIMLTIEVEGQPVVVPAYVGVDRVRAVQAPVHTHDASGEVWLEGRGNREVTLGQFFQLWGVRLDARCLGASCRGVVVLVDGEVREGDPRSLVLREVADQVHVRSA